MSVDAADLKAMLQQQLKLMDALTDRLAGTVSIQAPSGPSLDQAITSMTEFLFDPAAGITFDAWFER